MLKRLQHLERRRKVIDARPTITTIEVRHHDRDGNVVSVETINNLWSSKNDKAKIAGADAS
jgi:hypothetical protein